MSKELQLAIEPNLLTFCSFHPTNNINHHLKDDGNGFYVLNTSDMKVIEEAFIVLFDYYEPTIHGIDDKLKVLGSIAYLKEMNCIESIWLCYGPETSLTYELDVKFKDTFDERDVSGFCYCLLNLVSRSHKVVKSNFISEPMIFNVELGDEFAMTLKGFESTSGENYEEYEHPISKPYCCSLIQ